MNAQQQQQDAGFSACDMTTAGAQGFRAGQASAPSLNGILLNTEWFHNGRALISSTGEQLQLDQASDCAIVFDPATGIMEAVNASGFEDPMTHDEATKLVAALAHAGYKDWTLPDVPEAVHSVDYSRFDPAADPLLFPDAKIAGYWTRQQTPWSLDEEGSSRSFFYVGMSLGGVGSDNAYYRLRARPVRRVVPAGQCSVIE